MKFILWGKFIQCSEGDRQWKMLGVYLNQIDANAELFWIMQNELHSDKYRNLIALKVF